MGHVRNYTIGDVLARFMRMQGRNALEPMGCNGLCMLEKSIAYKKTGTVNWEPVDQDELISSGAFDGLDLVAVIGLFAKNSKQEAFW